MINCCAMADSSAVDDSLYYSESDEYVLSTQGELIHKFTHKIIIDGKCRPSAQFCSSGDIHAVAFSDNCIMTSNDYKIKYEQADQLGVTKDGFCFSVQLQISDPLFYIACF